MDDSDPDLAEIRDGCLVLKGTKDTADSNVRDYREAGVWTRDTFTLQYGKVEFRARFDSVQGVWPALWLNSGAYGWPTGGEIDVMEHLNYEGRVYQTVHMGGKDGVENKDWSFGVTPGIDKTVFNTYGVEWEPGEIRFFVNGRLTGTFTKDGTSAEHWPFDKEDNGFYLIMSMQIGGNWVENAGVNKGIDAATLYREGAEIEIDYVRVWQDSSMVPEPSAAGLFAGTLDVSVDDARTLFAPAEYFCGLAFAEDAPHVLTVRSCGSTDADARVAEAVAALMKSLAPGKGIFRIFVELR